MIASKKIQHLTLEGSAFKNGFQNKATFFKVFRDLENMNSFEYKSRKLENKLVGERFPGD